MQLLAKLNFLSLLLIAQASLSAIIVEHSSLHALVNYLDTPNTLVVFDIDNTLVKTPGHIGSDQWFYYQIQQKLESGMSFYDAINSILPVYFEIHFHIPLLLVESTAPSIINQLQNQKIPMIAITARSIHIANRTLKQLHNLGIDFSTAFPAPEIHFNLASKIPCMLKHGVIFIGNNDKGEVLLEFFEKMHYKPAKVIALDDKLKYLTAYETALEKQSIPFIGIRYSGCDEHVSNFNAQEAEEELAAFYANYGH